MDQYDQLIELNIKLAALVKEIAERLVRIEKQLEQKEEDNGDKKSGEGEL